MRPQPYVSPHYQPDLAEQYRFERQRQQQLWQQQQEELRRRELSRRNQDQYRRRDSEFFENRPSRDGTVVSVDGQSRPDYERMIKDKFQYTQDNYGDAYKAAARSGLPIVAVFGSFENNNSRSMIQDSLPLAQQNGKQDAIYLYIDRAKCKDPAMAAFADAQFAGGHNAAVALVCNVKPDQNGNPVPEPYNFRWQGGDASYISSFNQSLSQAKERMDSYRGQFRIDESVAPNGNAPAPSPVDLTRPGQAFEPRGPVPDAPIPDATIPDVSAAPRANRSQRSAESFEPDTLLADMHPSKLYRQAITFKHPSQSAAARDNSFYSQASWQSPLYSQTNLQRDRERQRLAAEEKPKYQWPYSDSTEYYEY